MTQSERSARGHRAFAEFSEIQYAFDAVEAAILRELANCPIGQEPKVLNLHKAAQNLSAVRKAIQHVVDDGKVAEHEMAASEALAVSGLNRPN
jgi:hypothetical protein